MYSSQTENMNSISVVIPTLNRAKYLRGTIDSVLRQSNMPFECIVIDGGSNDETVDILRSYDDRLKWISEPDRGHVDAIMKGWKMANGDYLAWLNADDQYLGTEALYRLADYLNKHPECDVVYGDYILIDDNGKPTGPVQRSGEWDLYIAATRCTNIIPQPASLIRRSALERVGWLDYEFEYCKDHELWLRIGKEGTLTHISVPIAYISLSSGISNHGKKTADGKVRLTEKFFSATDLPSPLDTPQVKKRALSIAYLKGATMILKNDSDIISSLVYIVKAFILDPVYTLRRFIRKIFHIQWA